MLSKQVKDAEMDALFERLKALMVKRHANFAPVMFGKTIPNLGELFIGVDPGDHVNKAVITRMLKKREPKEGEPQYIVLDSYSTFKET
jgi:hypothetical protein